MSIVLREKLTEPVTANFNFFLSLLAPDPILDPWKVLHNDGWFYRKLSDSNRSQVHVGILNKTKMSSLSISDALLVHFSSLWDLFCLG